MTVPEIKRLNAKASISTEKLLEEAIFKRNAEYATICTLIQAINFNKYQEAKLGDELKNLDNQKVINSIRKNRIQHKYNIEDLGTRVNNMISLYQKKWGTIFQFNAPFVENEMPKRDTLDKQLEEMRDNKLISLMKKPDSLEKRKISDFQDNEAFKIIKLKFSQGQENDIDILQFTMKELDQKIEEQLSKKLQNFQKHESIGQDPYESQYMVLIDKLSQILGNQQLSVRIYRKIEKNHIKNYLKKFKNRIIVSKIEENYELQLKQPDLFQTEYINSSFIKAIKLEPYLIFND